MRGTERWLWVTCLVSGGLALALQLRPRTAETSGFLSIESWPTGADVRVDGKEQGKSPLQLRVDPGSHSVELRKADFAVAKSEPRCQAGETVVVTHRLEPLRGTLKLKEAADATLFLGPGVPRKLTGKGPWQLAAGRYEVTAVRGASRAEPRKVDLKAGQDLEVALNWGGTPANPPPEATVAPPAETPRPRPTPAVTSPRRAPAQPTPLRPVASRPTVQSPPYVPPISVPAPYVPSSRPAAYRPAPRPAGRPPARPAPRPAPRPYVVPDQPSALWTPIGAPHQAPGGAPHQAPAAQPEPLFTPLP